MWFLGIGKNLVRHTRLVIELRGVPFECQKQILFYACDRIRLLRALKMDSGGNGAYLAEVALNRYGARVEPIQFSESWYREQMPPFKSAFEDGMIVIPMDRDIHTDLRALKLIRGIARVADRTRVDETRSRHGDAAIAGALAYYGSRAAPEEYGYEAVKRDQDPADANRWRDRAEDWDDERRPAASSALPALR
jgi:phage FluMu gp28-like protein